MNNDIYKRQEQFLRTQLNKPRYCSFCGKPILLSPVDENNKENPNYQWEWQNKAHWKCAQEFYAKKMNEQMEGLKENNET